MLAADVGALGDGAEWCPRCYAWHCPDAVRILALGHAAAYRSAAGRRSSGSRPPRGLRGAGARHGPDSSALARSDRPLPRRAPAPRAACRTGFPRRTIPGTSTGSAAAPAKLRLQIFRGRARIPRARRDSSVGPAQSQRAIKSATA